MRRCGASPGPLWLEGPSPPQRLLPRCSRMNLWKACSASAALSLRVCSCSAQARVRCPISSPRPRRGCPWKGTRRPPLKAKVCGREEGEVAGPSRGTWAESPNPRERALGGVLVSRRWGGLCPALHPVEPQPVAATSVRGACGLPAKSPARGLPSLPTSPQARGAWRRLESLGPLVLHAHVQLTEPSFPRSCRTPCLHRRVQPCALASCRILPSGSPEAWPCPAQLSPAGEGRACGAVAGAPGPAGWGRGPGAGSGSGGAPRALSAAAAGQHPRGGRERGLPEPGLQDAPVPRDRAGSREKRRGREQLPERGAELLAQG